MKQTWVTCDVLKCKSRELPAYLEGWHKYGDLDVCPKCRGKAKWVFEVMNEHSSADKRPEN